MWDILSEKAIQGGIELLVLFFKIVNPTGTIEVTRIDGTGSTLPASIPTSARVDGVVSTNNPASFTNLAVSGNPYTASAIDRPAYREAVASCNIPGCTLFPGQPGVTYFACLNEDEPGSDIAPCTCDGIFCSLDVDVADGMLRRVFFLYDRCAPGFEKAGDMCVPTTTFAIGDRIQVNTGDGSNLNVRSTPGGSIVGQQPDGSQGTVIGGPVFTDGLWWWQIDYDDGPDGWSVEDFLVGPSPEPGPNVGDIIRIPMLSGGLNGIAPEANGTTALVAESSGELSRVDLATGQVTTVALVDPFGIGGVVIEPSGTSALVLMGSSGLSRVNLDTGAVTTIVEGGIGQAEVIALESGGDSALVTGSSGELWRVNLATRAITKVSDVGGRGIAIEPGGATALIATGIFGGVGDITPCELARVDLATGAATTVAPISCRHRPVSVAIEPGGATALVVTSISSAGEFSEIYRVDLSTGTVAFLAPCPVCSVPRIVLEPSGKTALFIGDSVSSLIRFNLITLEQTTLARSTSPTSMAVSTDRAMAYTANATSLFSGVLFQVDLVTGQVDQIALTGSPGEGMDLDAPETTVFMVSILPSRVERVNLVTGQVTLAVSFPSGLRAVDLALERGGNTALVTAQDGQSQGLLLRVDLASGSVSTVSNQLVSPGAVAIEEEGVSALVVEGDRSLWRVNLQTGIREVIVTQLDPTGQIGAIANLGDIALEPSGQTALVAIGGELLRVNLTTTEDMTTIASHVCGHNIGLTGVVFERSGDTALLSHFVCGILRVRILSRETVTIDDDFNDNSLNLALWSPYVAPTPAAGTVIETNQRLEVSLNPGEVNAGVSSKCSVSGDFDVQVDFTLLNWPPDNRQGFSLGTTSFQGIFGSIRIERFSGADEVYHMVFLDSVGENAFTTAMSGTLRLVRTGATLSGYFRDGANFVLLDSVSVSTAPTGFVLNGGVFRTDATAASFAFDNFQVNAGTVTCP